MKRLLISVRNLEEAELALHAGCDLLDIKDPSRGALGRADDGIITDIIRYRDLNFPQIPVSAALGEFYQAKYKPFFMPNPQPDYIKWGTSSFSPFEFNPERYFDINNHSSVGVFYADFEHAQGLSLAQLLEIKEFYSSGIILFDTFNKSGPGLLDLMTHTELKQSIEQCRTRGLQVALAGKITLEIIPLIKNLDFQILGLRSAVCKNGSREQMLDPDKIIHIKKLLGYQFAEITL